MKIHEYQAKALLAQYGVAVPNGEIATTADEAYEAAKKLGGAVVVKAQIHSGGRGKAGGVKLVKSPEQARDAASAMLGSLLVTKQTGAKGEVVRKLLITEAAEIKKEYYLSVTVDTANNGVALIASAEGGTEIEDVAAAAPELIHTKLLPLETAGQAYHALEAACKIGIPAALRDEFCGVVGAITKLLREKDCSTVEINPLAETAGGLAALDAKINFDDNALARHADIAGLWDEFGDDEREREAKKHGLSYVALDGNIGCMVNGAGLAMATMDIIKAFGGEPANFLDVGGGASAEKVAAAFRIILCDKNVKAILVNIFGGIMKCDDIANGIVAAAKEQNIGVPLVVRLEGTNAAEGKAILDSSDLDVISASSMADAARKVCGRVAQ